MKGSIHSQLLKSPTRSFARVQIAHNLKRGPRPSNRDVEKLIGLRYPVSRIVAHAGRDDRGKHHQVALIALEAMSCTNCNG